MTNHPRRSRARLAEYGARLRTIDGRTVVEMIDTNDGSRARYQYRRAGAGIERRVLAPDGTPDIDSGSRWEPVNLAALMAVRGQYHPILDPLGF